MNGKTMLLLVLVALGGIILGAVGMQYFGSWEGVAQALGVLRQPGSPTPVATRAAASQPTDQAEHDAHEGHTHEEHTSEQGAAPHAHSHDEPGPAAATGAALIQGRHTEHNAVYPCGSTGGPPSKPDAHWTQGSMTHKHGAEQPRQANATGCSARQDRPARARESARPRRRRAWP